MSTRVWQRLECPIDVYFPVAVNSSIKVGPLVFLL